MRRVTETRQQEYNKKWADSHKEHKRYLSYRSTTRTFIRKYATEEDLQDLLRLIEEREEQRRSE